MKILFIDPAVNSGTSYKYRYYDGLYNELIKHHEVYHCRNIPHDFKNLYVKMGFKPECIIFGLGWFNCGHFDKIDNIDVPSVCFLFKPQNDLEKKLKFCKINNIDLILTPAPDYQQYEQKSGVRTELFPYGFDPALFKKKNVAKKYDIGFSGALHQSVLYPNDSFKINNLRPKIGQILQNQQEISVFWNSSDDASTAFIDNHEEYAATIGMSRMWIATLAAFGDVTPRYYEVLGSGTVLVCQKIPDVYKFLLKDGTNCIEFDDDLSKFIPKIKYYLQNEEELNRISRNALEFFHENWTWAHRAQELINLVVEIKK